MFKLVLFIGFVVMLVEAFPQNNDNRGGASVSGGFAITGANNGQIGSQIGTQNNQAGSGQHATIYQPGSNPGKLTNTNSKISLAFFVTSQSVELFSHKNKVF